MIVQAQINRKYELVRPYVERVSKRVGDIIKNYCEESGYAYLGRIKNSESLAEKIESGRYGSWSEIDDLFACSIIIPTVFEEHDVVEYLNGNFQSIKLKSRRRVQKDPSVFRFDATRFIGCLKEDPMIQNTPMLSIRFEVQIRTAFEHAWSVATHALAYKSAKVDWRRLRLSAQLKASVEQLDLLIAAYDNISDNILEQRWPEVIAKKEIADFFIYRFELGVIPEEVKPKDWSRFCDNVYKIVMCYGNSRDRDKVKIVKGALRNLNDLFDDKSFVFPMCLSLVQFVIGALAKCGFVDGESNEYIPFLSEELLSIFPETAVLGSGFDCEL